MSSRTLRSGLGVFGIGSAKLNGRKPESLNLTSGGSGTGIFPKP